MWCITEIDINGGLKEFFVTPFSLGTHLKGTITLTDYDTGNKVVLNKISAIRVYRPVGFAEFRNDREYVYCFKVISKPFYDFLGHVDCYTIAIRGKYSFTSLSLNGTKTDIDLKDDYLQCKYQGHVLKPVKGSNHVLWYAGYGSGTKILTIFEVFDLLCSASDILLQRDNIALLTDDSVKTVIKINKKCRLIYTKTKTLRRG